MLRHEDLDRERARPEFEAAVRQDLAWLGIDWDEERRQSDATGPLELAAQRLLDAGAAFPCVCSRGDLRATGPAASAASVLSAPHGGAGARYPGTCRSLYRSREEALASTGRTAALRFRAHGDIAFQDGFAAEAPVPQPDDVVVVRRDGAIAYHLAVVVDDARDGITEVVRGDDLLSSTPLHLELQRALGCPTPQYYHVPLVVDAEGVRLAKRHAALSLKTLRERGVSAAAVVRAVAQSANLAPAPGGVAPAYLGAFSFSRLPKTPVVLNVPA